MKQQFSDEKLYDILGAELTNSDMINSKIEEAYVIIRKQSKTNQKRKKSKVFIGFGSAAAVLLLSVTFCVMNPVMAEELPIVGSLFAKLADIFPFGRIPDKNTALLYDGKADSPYQSCDGGVTVTLTQEYASNQAFYIGIRIENEKEFPDMAAYVKNGVQWLDIRTKETYSFWTEPIKTRRRIEGKFEDTHTFIGIMRIDYSEISIDEQFREDMIPDSFDMTLELTQIIGTLKNPTRPEGMKSEAELMRMNDEERADYQNSLPREWVGFPNQYQHWYAEGTWSFAVPVAKQDEEAKLIVLHEINEAGYGIESIELSSVEMTLHVVRDTEEAVIALAFDADGREIEYGGSGGVYVLAGHDISTISIYICRFEDWEQVQIAMENAENNKDMQEMTAACALFETVVDTLK